MEYCASFSVQELYNLEPESFSLSDKNYVSLDWHPKAKEYFYNEKSAEEFAQDESYHAKMSQKKQSVRLDECLELYTSKEKLGENDAWSVSIKVYMSLIFGHLF